MFLVLYNITQHNTVHSAQSYPSVDMCRFSVGAGISKAQETKVF